MCFFKFALQPKEILVPSSNFVFTGVKFTPGCLKNKGRKNRPRLRCQKIKEGQNSIRLKRKLNT